MEKKINIAELLKDCPKGMGVDCTMFDNVTFVRVDNSRKQFPIEIAVSGIRSKYLTKEGCFHDTTLLPEAKCVIFPKGKTTWEGFVPPCKFKNGDIISDGNYIAIFYKIGTPCHCTFSNVVYYHCYYSQKFYTFKNKLDYGIGVSTAFKYATEEEKEKLFQAIRNNGCCWDHETKTLNKLTKFKVGDKFDITTLKPFDKVLVRDFDNGLWDIEFFSRLLDGKHFKCLELSYVQCIPYEGNEHLLGTTDDCDVFYKTW